MLIKNLYIDAFGKFHNTSLNLQEGINIIEGDNEAGKSTLHTFIRSMLFGIERGRGRAAKKDDHSRFLPHQNAGDYGGSIRFEHEEHSFLLKRHFYEKNTSLLFDETTGHQVDSFIAVDSLIPGLTSDSFNETVCIGQLRLPTGEALTEAVKSHLINLPASGSIDIDVTHALKKLNTDKKVLERRMNDAYPKNLDSINVEITETHRLLEEKINSFTQHWLDSPKPAETVTAGKTPGKAARGLLPALLLPAVLLCLGVAAGNLSIGFPIGYFIILIVYGIFRANKTAGKINKVQEVFDNSNEKQALRLEWEAEKLQEELNRLLENKSLLESQKAEADEIRKELEAYQLSIRKLEQLVNQRTAVENPLNSYASELLSAMTCGSVDAVFFNDSGDIHLKSGSQIIPLTSASQGTRDQVYLSLRLAAVKYLFPEEELPLLFDESFAFFDNNRLLRTLNFLADTWPGQIIIFTCHTREHQILLQQKTAHHHIRMTK